MPLVVVSLIRTPLLLVRLEDVRLLDLSSANSSLTELIIPCRPTSGAMEVGPAFWLLPSAGSCLVQMSPFRITHVDSVARKVLAPPLGHTPGDVFATAQLLGVPRLHSRVDHD